MDKKELTKDFALMEEIEASIKLTKLGLGELQNITENNKFYYLPFQLLSSGFERFMKCYLCLGYYNVNGEYPKYNYIKNIGHDLYTLLAEINTNYFKVDERSILLKDKEFLESDEEFLELLHILSEFGQKARYYNLDVITDNVKISIDANEEWRKFENGILGSHNLYAKLSRPDESYEVYDFISNYIIKIFERFLGSLCRQMMYGFVGDRGRQLSLSLTDFGMIFERDLGKTDYRKNTTRYKQMPLKAHKRTIKDKMDRRFNKNFKSKVITKSDYDGIWPFYVEEIIVECRYGHWCIVSVEGYDYALNGSAKGRYKLDNPFDGGVIIPGTTFTEFIKIAFEL